MNFKEVYQTVLKDYPEIMSVEETSAALGVSTFSAPSEVTPV